MAFGRQPKSMNELLQEFMKRIPRQTELKRGMVLHVWPDVVGEQINDATRKIRFDGSTLVITVTNEAWRHELHANRFSIAKKLNNRVQARVVKKIIVRT